MLFSGDNKFLSIVQGLMAVGLFLQILGPVLYTSGSANGVHVYLLLIFPSLLLLIWGVWNKVQLFSKDTMRFLLAAGLFISVCTISAAWGDGENTVGYVFRKGLVIMLYLSGVICLVSMASWQNLKWFMIIICAVAAIGAVVSVCYQLVVVNESFGWRTFRIYRMGLGEWVDLGYPVIAGIYFGLFAALAVCLIVIDSKNNKAVVILGVSVLLLLPYVFLTFSRTSWIAGAVSVGYLSLIFRHRASLVLAACLALIAIVMAAVYHNELLIELTERQLSNREQIWVWTLNNILEHPLLGHGFAHSFWPETVFAHAHNFYLQVLFEQGIVGLCSFLAMLSVVIHAVWKNKEERWVVGLFALVIYILMVMMVEIQHVITRPGLYWTVFWFPLALVVGLVNRNASLNLTLGTQKKLD
ncbi:MAG: O-antigen ligase family protein [Porticoccaceae bacterium]